jgi:hypothetical protein
MCILNLKPCAGFDVVAHEDIPYPDDEDPDAPDGWPSVRRIALD